MFDEILEDVESANAKKEEDINAIFESLEHSDLDDTIVAPRQEL